MAASTKQRIIHSRSFDKQISRQRQEKQDLEVSETAAHLSPPWTPSGYTAFKVLLSARLCAAIWSNVSDCDETFNYWEPMYYLLHGYGFQTWEYSPAYAIRSYAYVWLYAWPLKLYMNVLGPNKILQFYSLRCLLSVVCALCETFFYKAVCRQFGANTGRIFLFLMVLSTAMFISCTAFMPSSFAMYTTMIAMAGWFLGNWPVAVLATAAGAIIGWPFAAVLGIPIACDILLRRRQLWCFVKWSLVSLVLFLIPLVQIDSYYYGGLVVAPLNIILYNVFSDHGPDIYGTEPWTYYFVNGFLNFNIAFPLALLSLPFVLLLDYILSQPRKEIPVWLSLSPMYIWILIFFTRPHKEERFLFPIYPLISLAAAASVDYLQKAYARLRNSKRKSIHYTECSYLLAVVFCAVFGVISLSRLFALYHGYHAPLDVYGEFQQKVLTAIEEDSKLSETPVNVCVGKEWYRFPGNFFLPLDNWRLQFIKSEFRGQLPKPYGPGPRATQEFPAHMNDLNAEEPTRYINVTRCHFLIDLDVQTATEFEPRYSQNLKEWTAVVTAKFLDNPRSHRFFRAFFIPFLSNRYVKYIDYNVLQSSRTGKRFRIFS